MRGGEQKTVNKVAGEDTGAIQGDELKAMNFELLDMDQAIGGEDDGDAIVARLQFAF